MSLTGGGLLPISREGHQPHLSSDPSSSWGEREEVSMSSDGHSGGCKQVAAGRQVEGRDDEYGRALARVLHIAHTKCQGFLLMGVLMSSPEAITSI